METPNAATPKPAPVRHADAFQSVSDRYFTAPTSAEKSKLIKENKDLVSNEVFHARHIEQSVLPFYESMTQWASENAWYDKFRMLRDGILTGLAGAVVVKGIKLAYFWVKGP